MPGSGKEIGEHRERIGVGKWEVLRKGKETKEGDAGEGVPKEVALGQRLRVRRRWAKGVCWGGEDTWWRGREEGCKEKRGGLFKNIY